MAGRMNQRASAIEVLQTNLGYSFKDKTLLELALTHASVAEGARKMADNERLEFLGDRILGMMMAEALIDAFPKATEGELSKRIHALVNRDACADVARKVELGAALRLAAGESKSGGRDKATILGDALEALIAAVYLDGGYATVKACFIPLWQSAITDSSARARHDPKTVLQEWAASKKTDAPAYDLVGRKGPDHAPVFTIELSVKGFDPARAEGRSRQEAEKAAALNFITREGLT
jgi:ribonuclease III